jgi:NAD(P)-dependent dehydrogenase (short-subunit alcohol dehydrogenase family)
MNTPVVLIPGALTGIGRATALALAKEGARVVIAGRRDEAGQNLVAEFRRLPAEAEYAKADVRHEDDVRNLLDKTVARFGRLDLAVNAAETEGNYAILRDGELWLELDDGETVHLSAGDIVVQQATRHGWHNKGERPATIAFVMLGTGPAW